MVKLRGSKRALSPVVATSLLIAIALVLALIIFIWAKSFIGEALQKDLGTGAVDIEQACAQVNMKADVDSATGLVIVENDGNVPIYGIRIMVEGLGSQTSKEVFDGTISTGQTVNVNVASSITFSSGSSVRVIPIIVGTSDSGKKQYACEKQGIDVIAI